MSNAAVAKTRVLVVEDDLDAREIYEGTLRFAGYDVTTAGTIAEGQRAAQVRRPHLVVLDGRLPDGHGTELVRRWKKIPSMAEVPVVMITAFSQPEDIQAATQAGADAFVVKPCSGDALTTYLARVLAGSAPTRKLPKLPMSQPRLSLVYPCGGDELPNQFHVLDDGKLQARCSSCLRPSPVLGKNAGEAEARAVDLGWTWRSECWVCPVCHGRKKTLRPA